MPLQHLVEYFNDRFEREHYSGFRPFVLNEGKVGGLYGKIRIDSSFTPLRQALKPAVIVGHTSQITITPNKIQQLFANETVAQRAKNSVKVTDIESIVNFDRLCRTVHMLNYLTLSHLQGVLCLEVDPRHIMDIKQDHGAYFEEVIARCGLETKNVVIVLVVNSQYAFYYQELVIGLDNYRRRGYQIALKFDYLALGRQAFSLIARLSPNYVSFSARHIEDHMLEDIFLAKLYQFKIRVASVGGKSILQQIDEKNADFLARYTGFDLVEGEYYRAIAFDYFSNVKSEHYDLKANY